MLIPALLAVCLFAVGFAALFPNPGTAPLPGGRTVMGRVETWGRCRGLGSVQEIGYVVNGVHYHFYDTLTCYAPGQTVAVSYLPGDPGDSRVISTPSLVSAYLAFSLAWCAVVVGVGLRLRRDHVLRRVWHQLHRYATGPHPLG